MRKRFSILLLLAFAFGEIYWHFAAHPETTERLALAPESSWRELLPGSYQAMARRGDRVLLGANLGSPPFLVLSLPGLGLRRPIWKSRKLTGLPVAMSVAETDFAGRRYYRPLGGMTFLGFNQNGRLAVGIDGTVYVARGNGWLSYPGTRSAIWLGKRLLLCQNDGLFLLEGDRRRLLAAGAGFEPVRRQGSGAILANGGSLLSLRLPSGLLHPARPSRVLIPENPPPGWRLAGYPVSRIDSNDFLVTLAKSGKLGTFLYRRSLLSPEKTAP